MRLVEIWDHNPPSSVEGVPLVCIGKRRDGDSDIGQTLPSGSDDQTIRLWDLQTEHCLYVWREHTGWVRSVIFSSNGQVLFSGSDERTIKLWDVQAGCCIETLTVDRL